MRYSVNVPNFGEFAAPEVFAEVARRAEEAGWDALLVGDSVAGEKELRWEIADPWILLAAAALATRRIRLGTAITPVARRRPSKLAREVTTLDRLTGGRMILGAGLGDPVDGEYGSFGDTTDTKVLAERLDEGLHALDLLWSGEPVTYRGNQITIDDVVFRPAPVQRPRVPIWVGGFWPHKAPMRRAARWDGAIPVMAGWESGGPPGLGEVSELVRFLRGCRAANGLAGRPFDIVIGGASPSGPTGRDLAGPLADLGVTWWDERMPWDDGMGRAEPGARISGAQQYRDFLGGFMAQLTGVETVAAFGDDTTAVLFYYPHTANVSDAPTAECFAVTGGKITRSVLVFDRPSFAPPQR